MNSLLSYHQRKVYRLISIKMQRPAFLNHPPHNQSKIKSAAEMKKTWTRTTAAHMKSERVKNSQVMISPSSCVTGTPSSAKVSAPMAVSVAGSILGPEKCEKATAEYEDEACRTTGG
jgi:hypothetical protein